MGIYTGLVGIAQKFCVFESSPYAFTPNLEYNLLEPLQISDEQRRGHQAIFPMAYISPRISFTASTNSGLWRTARSSACHLVN